MSVGPILLFLSPLAAVVAGALAAFLFQQQQWKLRRELELREKRVEVARATFEEISRLMDKRLYCLAQFLLWTKRSGEEKRLKEAHGLYKEVVREWNCSFNRHLAMLQIFFGDRVRQELDSGVGLGFVSIGAEVERFHRRRSATDEELASIDKAIAALYSDIYFFNLMMLDEIQSQETLAGIQNRPKTARAARDVSADMSAMILVRPLDAEPVDSQLDQDRA